MGSIPHELARWLQVLERGQRFHFFGYELWISEFAIVFFSLMFLMFVVAAMAMFCGRMYCSYLCPQMIFSEASLTFESKLQRTINRYLRWDAKKRKLFGKSLFFRIAGMASAVLAFGLIAYFVEPRGLFHRLLSFDIRPRAASPGR